MFKPLRRALLLLNLSVISIVMIASFTSVYPITYANIKGDIDMELSGLAEPSRRPGGSPDGPRGTEQPPEPPPDALDAPEPPERSVFFSVSVDASEPWTRSVRSSTSRPTSIRAPR